MSASLSIDTFVGQQLRRFRLQRGLSQSAVGAVIGVTFQQIQKYEHGTNRISAGHLHAFAEALRIPVASFFPTSEVQAAQDDAMPAREHTVAMHVYAAIGSAEQRKALRTLMRTMGAMGGKA